MTKLQKLDLLETLSNDVNELKHSVEYCHNSIDDIAKENKVLKQTIESMKADLEASRKANKENHEMIIEQQWRSMRSNLLFHGIAEATPGQTEDCIPVLRKFIQDELGFDVETCARLSIARAHRIGKKIAGNGKSRPSVAKFDLYKDREAVRGSSRKLAGKKFGISEQLPSAWHLRRKELMPKFRESKNLGHKAVFNKDKLFVNGQEVFPDKRPQQMDTQ